MGFTSEIGWYNRPDFAISCEEDGSRVEDTSGEYPGFTEELREYQRALKFPGPLLRRRFLITALFPEPAAGMGRGPELTHAPGILPSPSHPSFTQRVLFYPA